MLKDGAPSLSYALTRLRNAIRPPVTITPAPPEVFIERDIEVPMRDGTVLRVNVFRPRQGGRHPVIMSAHPYGKDNLPRRVGPGRYRLPMQYRLLNQMMAFRHSSLTSWEAPDPAFWVPRGYVVVNCDIRGFGKSDGVDSLLSAQEGEDYHDLIEWAAAQPWSIGRIGLCGVSYLALTQWRAAETRPPHLAAICPWEGFSDVYRDIAFPGGIRERGFLKLWRAETRRAGRTREDIEDEQARRPERDAFWASRAPDLAAIQVPALICGSFSDHTLHTRGAFRAFARISSEHRWLYTHRGPKWASFYAPQALEVQQRFFDWALKGEDNGQLSVPAVRLEVRRSRDEIHQVRHEAAWPLPSTQWTRLALRGDGTLAESPPGDGGALSAASTAVFDMRRGRSTFTWTVPRDMEITGPMKLRLFVEVRGASDVSLFVGVRKFVDGREVVFHGPYGFGLDMVSHGWLKASHRELDVEQSTEEIPVHTHVAPRPLSAGEIVPLDIALLPSATFFEKGSILRADVQGRWFYPCNPFTGMFPGRYVPSGPGTCVLHLAEAYLLVPVIG